MSPTLQRAINELNHLTPQEQWKLLGYLTNQLQAAVHLEESPQPTLRLSANTTADIATLLEETKGIWGDKSLEEIDDELDKQRQSDWGE
jgi:hypothetical protein